MRRAILLGPIAVALAVVLLAPAGTAGAAQSSAATPSAVAPNPYATDASAALAIGQTALNTTGCGTTNTTLVGPSDVTFDAAGDLWVDDRSNNRVLEFTPPFHLGMGASIVLGQSGLTTGTAATTQSGLDFPSGIAFDQAGDLWVADRTNNRVVEFVPPFSDGMLASVVLGQDSFTTSSTATTVSGLNNPDNLGFAPNGDLFVADSDNDRVLEYVPPFHTDMNASLVLGQSGFTTGSAGVNASALDFPVGLAVGPTGDLFVADAGNSRILVFDPPFSNGMAASLVLGQSTFTTNGAAASPTGLNFPYDLAFDGAGDLWVADSANNRVVEYLPPFSDGMAASVAIGQANLSAGLPGSGPKGLTVTHAPAFDAAGNLWVADQGNCRITEYAPPHYTVRFVESGLAAGTEWAASVGSVAAASTSDNLTVTVENGSYAYTIGKVAGYLVTPRSGSLSINGSIATVYVRYAPAIAGLAPAEFTLAILAPILVVALGVAFLLVRRRGRGSRPPVRPMTPASIPPPEGPPPGAAQ